MAQHPSAQHRISPMHRTLLVTGFVVSPLIVLVLLVVWIDSSLRNPNIRKLPPIGAGAGQTGGANALGEKIKELQDQTPVASPAAFSPAPVMASWEGIESGDGTASASGASAMAVDAAEMINPIDLPQGFMVVVNDKTGKSSASSPIYMAGSMNGWNPGDPRFKLTPQSDMKWRLLITPQTLATKPSTLEFKFTRGTWDLEELNTDFTVPANKLLPKIKKSDVKEGVPPQIEYTVVAWVDSDPKHRERHLGPDYRTINATGTLRRLQVRGGVGDASHRSRDLQVWLPEGYDAPENATRTYPVLYLHDGQNVFEKLDNVPGEWNADETAGSLIKAGQVQPLIIVGVPHSGGSRINEYLPIDGARAGVDAQGDVHVAWLMGEVMPRVERAFRVSKQPSETFLGGASLGAIISIEAYSKNPGRFGGLLLESPSLTLGDKGMVQQWLATKTQWPAKVFVGGGGKEFGADGGARNDEYVKAVQAFEQRIATSGSSVKLMVDQDATHNEAAWSSRFDDALKFLVPAK